MDEVLLLAAGGHGGEGIPLVVLERQHEAHRMHAEVHHAAAAAVFQQLGKRAVRAAVAFARADVQGLTELTALQNALCLAEGGSEEPVLGVIDVLSKARGGIDHVLRILDGRCQRLFADDAVTGVQRLDGDIVVQEIRHADVHEVALALGDGGIIIVIDLVAGKAVALSQRLDAVGRAVADADDLHLVKQAAVAVGMKVGGKRRADQQYT